MLWRCWLWFLAFFHLDNEAVCRLSEGLGPRDYHDYDDDEMGVPAHFVTLRCRRCGKEFII